MPLNEDALWEAFEYLTVEHGIEITDRAFSLFKLAYSPEVLQALGVVLAPKWIFQSKKPKGWRQEEFCELACREMIRGGVES